jgi:signal transduction histidine kinase
MAKVSTVVRSGPDVTKQKSLPNGSRLAKKRHREHLNTQREFVSMFAHEIRTPLTAIQGAHYLLSRQLAKVPPDAAKAFDRLLNLQAQALTSLGKLVDQVLLLNHLDQGRVDQAAMPCRIGRNVAQWVVPFNDGSLPHRVQLIDQLPARYSPVVDASLLRIVVENLVSNCINYSTPDSPVIVTLCPSEGGWKLTVADRGRGIPKNEQAGLFNPFFRASNVAAVPGTGLGLAIVKRALEFCDGTIAIESEPGVGTTFLIDFPGTRQAPHSHASST